MELTTGIRKQINYGLIKKIALGIIVVLAVYFVIQLLTSQSGWEIMRSSGQSMINGQKMNEGDTFNIEDIITTGDNSSVAFIIPEIGRVLIENSSTVKRIKTDFAIRVEKGQIKKYEGNATDFFVVETPLANIKELYKGSAFRLAVGERDQTNISVESGWIITAVKEFESYIPKNHNCVISRGRYVIPFSPDSSPELISMLEGFSGVNDPSIGTILSLAGPKEAIALWHILQLVSNENRFIVFDKLNEIIPVPGGVTKEGIQALNKDMLMKWRQEIELKMD